MELLTVPAMSTEVAWVFSGYFDCQYFWQKYKVDADAQSQQTQARYRGGVGSVCRFA